MASYRPFHPPPPSTFAPTPPLPPNQTPLQPPQPAHGGNQYAQNWGPYGSNEASNYSQNYSQGNPATNYHQHQFNLPPRNTFPPQTQQQQFQYQNPRPPPPPDASYPPPPPPPISASNTPVYYPSSQYPHFDQPPPPPPPPSSPPPPPPPSQPSPPPQAPSQQSFGVTKDSKLDPGVYPKTDLKPPLPASGKGSSGHEITDRVETEEERRVRKRREYEKQKQDDKMKQHIKELQNKVLPKIQSVPSGVKGHGSITGLHMADRSTPLLNSDRAENRLKKPTTFLCKMKFRNELPDPSAKMKILNLKRDPDRYCKYQITSLEKNWKPQLYVEPDLGIPLDLLDLSVYNSPKGERMHLDPRDEELLRDDDPITPVKADGIKIKERPTDKGVSWLVKTQYISPLSIESTKQPLTEKQAKELKEARDRDLLENHNNRDKQIKNITASFEACLSPPKHATNPQLKPKRVMPLFPDRDRLNDQFVIATFDSDPTVDSEIYGRLTAAEREEYEQRAIMKYYTSSNSGGEKPDRYLAYMVPSINELEKDMFDENEDISYSWVREYHFDVRRDDEEDPNTYVVTFGENEAKYLPLPMKFILRKKRAREGKQSEEAEHIRVPGSVTVRKRPTTAAMELREEDYAPSSKNANMSSRGRRDGIDRGSGRLHRVVEYADGDNFSGAEDDLSE